MHAPGLWRTSPDTPVKLIAAALSDGVPTLLSGHNGSAERIALLAWGTPHHSRPALSFLASNLALGQQLHVLTSEASGASPEIAAGVLGLRAIPTMHEVGGGLTEQLPRLRQLLEDLSIDLVVLTAPSGLTLRPLLAVMATLGTDILLVPNDQPLLPAAHLQLFAAVRGRRGVRTAAVSVDAAGGVWMPADADYTVVIDGHGNGTAAVVQGHLAVRVEGATFGLATDPEHPRSSLEAMAEVLALEGPRVAMVPDDVPQEVVELLRRSGRRVWCLASQFVAPIAVRARTGADAVLCLEAVLDQGHPRDEPNAAAAVRFDRGVRALRAEGMPIDVSLSSGAGQGYLGVSVQALLDDPTVLDRVDAVWVAPRGGDLGSDLVERCGAVRTAASRVQWLTDNQDARVHLLALIDGADERVHLQTFMFEEDRIGRMVADALERAAGRGVAVRVLVDSLWSLHGSLNQRRPLLERLEGVPGLELHAVRPVDALADLKSRDHRKLMVVDGVRAALHGRNISDHYFVGFDEIALSPTTHEEQVPWLDFSVGLEGAVARHMDATFLQTWEASGGAPFPLHDIDELGTPLWWISHCSLADAHTLDAFRVLLDHAQEQVTLVNTFTLCHELEHALFELLDRGVGVRVLVGHVRPHFQGGAEAFPGSPGRELMTALVHGRLDDLARAGADVRAFALEGVQGWHPELGQVLPHVHAKLLLVDGHVCATGSANVDISSSYWESEAMVVLDDAKRVGRLAAWLDGIMEGSVRFDPNDPEWVQRSAQRGWFSKHWPGMLS